MTERARVPGSDVPSSATSGEVEAARPRSSMLGARTGMLLDWSDVDKAMLLAGIPGPIFALSLVRVQLLLADPADEPYLSRPMLGVVRTAILFYTIGALVLGSLWPWLRKRRPDSKPFVVAALALFFSIWSIGAYFVGHSSTPILGGCVAGSIAVLLLFDAAIARPAILLGAIAHFAPVPFIALRLIPYAPLYAASPFIGPRPNLAWLLTTSAFGVIMLFVPVSLLISVLDRWRRRDAEIHRLARLDGLTEVPNRRYFHERLEAELSRARRYGSNLALLILDLDHFKRINDRHGHQIGDRALVRVAQLLSSDLLRRIDVVGRYGGEEFAVMLPETDLEGARTVAERIRVAIERTVLHLDDGGVVRMTASFGVAVRESHAVDTLDALVRRADGALYRAKENGRNRVEHEPLGERTSRA